MQQSLAEAVFAVSLNFLKRLSIAFCVLKNRRIHSDFTSIVIVCLAQVIFLPRLQAVTSTLPVQESHFCYSRLSVAFSPLNCSEGGHKACSRENATLVLVKLQLLGSRRH